MAIVSRKNPLFSLCGLNCCLCPRYHTEGSSKCPGCGGVGFNRQHPSCSVMSCSITHDNVEYCFQCSDYPCEKYKGSGTKDSFISYRKVKDNNARALSDIEGFLSELRKRMEYLDELLQEYNDGRRKGFFCLAVNDLPIETLDEIHSELKSSNAYEPGEIKERSQRAVELVRKKASELHIDLALRK